MYQDCADAFAKSTSLRHLTITAAQKLTTRSVEPPPQEYRGAQGRALQRYMASWNRQQNVYRMRQSDQIIRNAFFAACSDLQTVCIDRTLNELRLGHLWTKESLYSTTEPKGLPRHYAVRSAPLDRQGRFMIGIPHAFRTNSDDDDGDDAFRVAQEAELERLKNDHEARLDEMLELSAVYRQIGRQNIEGLGSTVGGYRPPESD